MFDKLHEEDTRVEELSADLVEEVSGGFIPLVIGAVAVGSFAAGYFAAK